MHAHFLSCAHKCTHIQTYAPTHKHTQTNARTYKHTCTHTHKHTQWKHCNTLQHTATELYPSHCPIAIQPLSHCNTLQHTATYRNTPQYTATHRNTLQRTATHCNALQHTATHCNTLQQSCIHHTIVHKAILPSPHPLNQRLSGRNGSSIILYWFPPPAPPLYLSFSLLFPFSFFFPDSLV